MSIFTVNKQSKTTNDVAASEIVYQIKKETTPKEFDAIYEIRNRDNIFELDQGNGRGTHALLQAVYIKNYSLISYITALGGKDLLDLSSDTLSPVRYAIYDMRLIKTLIVLGANVNGLAQKERAFSSSSLSVALEFSPRDPDLQTAQLLRGYGAQLTYSEMEDSQQARNFLLKYDEAHKREKEPIKKLLNATLLNATLDDPGLQKVNKIIMGYVVPPSIEINYTLTPRNESGPIKEVIDEILPSKSSIISEIVADYTQKSCVEISVID